MFLDLMTEMFIRPTEATIRKAKGSTQNYWQDGLTIMAITLFFVIMLAILAISLTIAFERKGLALEITDTTNNDFVILTILVAIGLIVFLIFSELANLLSVYIIVKIVGGQGSISQYFFVQSLYSSPMYVIGFMVMVFNTIAIAITVALGKPMNVEIDSIVGLILGIYRLLLYSSTLKVVFDIHGFKLFIAVFFPVIFLICAVCPVAILITGLTASLTSLPK